MANSQLDITSVTSTWNFGEPVRERTLFETEIPIYLKSTNLHSETSITQMKKLNRFLKKVSNLSLTFV